MKFEVSILVILAVRFGIPHVFVFSKSVYLTCLSLSLQLFRHCMEMFSLASGFECALRVSSEPNDVRRRCE